MIIAWLLGALACISCSAGCARAATVTASVSASNVKPLLLSKVQDLSLGTMTLGPGTWSNAIVSLSRTGLFVCPPINVTCTGVTSVAKYNVQGSNQQIVLISAPNVTMINQSDATKSLTLVVDSPISIVLPNSGIPGLDVSIGGSITLNSTTTAGTYVGTFNVTADYQ